MAWSPIQVLPTSESCLLWNFAQLEERDSSKGMIKPSHYPEEYFQYFALQEALFSFSFSSSFFLLFCFLLFFF
jgi:hypothetical protein